MAGTSKSLLFINESVIPSSPKTRREINAHVQKARHERLRQQRIDALRPQHLKADPAHAAHRYSDSSTPYTVFLAESSLPASLETRGDSDHSATGRYVASQGQLARGISWQESFYARDAHVARGGLHPSRPVSNQVGTPRILMRPCGGDVEDYHSQE